MIRPLLLTVLALLLATPALSVEHLDKQVYQRSEDFGSEQLYDGALQYYYYIPCRTYSWFSALFGWDPGDILGACFRTGDVSTNGWRQLDPDNCHTLEAMRVLDFAGYGTVYPGLFTVEFDVYCSAVSQSPFVPLWTSGPVETHHGWNYIQVDPPLSVCPCCEYDFMYPSFIVTLTMVGEDAVFPAVGFDNIGTPVELGCEMHDAGCLPAVYPRDQCGGTDPRVHSGYVGLYPFQYWPPVGFLDGSYRTPDGSEFGFIEWVLTLYINCSGPSGVEPSTWGSIKSMYK
jgi:hypothetical protein